MRTRQGRQFSQPARRIHDRVSCSRLSEVRTDLARCYTRKLGSSPRLCWPHLGLSFGRSGLGTCSLGQVRLQNAMNSAFFLSEVPPGYPKGMSSDHLVLETSKGVPTIRAGTPNSAHLEGP